MLQYTAETALCSILNFHSKYVKHLHFNLGTELNLHYFQIIDCDIFFLTNSFIYMFQKIRTGAFLSSNICMYPIT
jgi:hypothetical protein